MPFYKDVDGAIWLTGHRGDAIFFVSYPTVEDDVPAVGLSMDPAEVEATFGPLVEIQPACWEEV
ncbi:hypothetical protein [Streptomyces sp. NTK 937]|uniref:hypothetical protein n=1 Tax=Streptomyces sp. NTK 937 TaxID=1487711 RepID=UPI0004A941FE|nr:hypothetical protein [Streptomyces sp. NTK 937]KDQ65721.1 hypothetical protein DT87_00245 [Streptomyces sp. NTK 937]